MHIAMFWLLSAFVVSNRRRLLGFGSILPVLRGFVTAGTTSMDAGCVVPKSRLRADATDKLHVGVTRLLVEPLMLD